MEIVEENGKLIRKIELDEADIKAEVQAKEEQIDKINDEIQYLKGFLPAEEVESDSEDDEDNSQSQEDNLF